MISSTCKSGWRLLQKCNCLVMTRDFSVPLWGNTSLNRSEQNGKWSHFLSACRTPLAGARLQPLGHLSSAADYLYLLGFSRKRKHRQMFGFVSFCAELFGNVGEIWGKMFPERSRKPAGGLV